MLPLARRHQLSVYDSCYLELVVREKLPLASFDTALIEAAKREGMSVLGGEPWRSRFSLLLADRGFEDAASIP